MDFRTKNIEQLLNISKSRDNRDSDFKRDLYNTILSRLKFGLSIPKADAEDPDILFANDIINFVIWKYNISLDYFFNGKKRDAVLPRQIVTTILIDNTVMPLQKIGGLIAKKPKNHATLIYSHKTIDGLYDTDFKFKQIFEGIIKTKQLKYFNYITKEQIL